jgi:hypothetical protein
MVHGSGPLRVVPGHMDQHQYLQILSECLSDVINKYGMDKKNVIYQYDNDPKHKAKSVSNGRLSKAIVIWMAVSVT